VPQVDALGQAAKPLPPNQKASVSIKIHNARTPSASKALSTEKTPSTQKTPSIPKFPSIPKTPKTRLGRGVDEVGLAGIRGIHVQKGEHSQLGGELAPRGIFRTPRRGSGDRCDEDGRLDGVAHHGIFSRPSGACGR